MDIFTSNHTIIIELTMAGNTEGFAHNVLNSFRVLKSQTSGAISL